MQSRWGSDCCDSCINQRTFSQSMKHLKQWDTSWASKNMHFTRLRTKLFCRLWFKNYLPNGKWAVWLWLLYCWVVNFFILCQNIQKVKERHIIMPQIMCDCLKSIYSTYLGNKNIGKVTKMVFSLFCLKFWVNYKEKYEEEKVEKPVTSS